MQKQQVKELSKEELLQRFGASVRAHRDARELTQEQLAELCDLHVTYISQIERGLKNLSLFNIYRVALALDVAPGELFGNLLPAHARR